MKKNFLHLAFVGAIALVGSVGFSACSDDVSKELETNPVNGGQKVDFTDVVGVSDVPVDFVFNVSTKTGADTRMTAAATQKNGIFRGINKARLFAFQVSKDGNWVTNATAANGKMLKMYQELTSLMPSSTTTTYSSTRVLEITVPAGANAMLFYGTAPNSGNYEDHGMVDHNNHQGKLEDLILSYHRRVDDNTYDMFQLTGKVMAGIFTGLVDMGFKPSSMDDEDKDLYFWWPEGNNDVTKDNNYTLAQPISYTTTANDTYQQIYNSPKRTPANKTFSTTEEPMNYLAKHITTGIYDDGSPGNTAITDNKVNNLIVTKTEDGVKYTLYHSNVTWKAYGMWLTTDTSSETTFGGASEYSTALGQTTLSELGEKLGTAYKALTRMNVQELRSASNGDILALAKDLYDVIKKVADAKPTNKKEYVAKKFAERLVTRMQIYFDFTGDNPAWKTITGTNGWGNKLKNFAENAGNPITQVSTNLGTLTISNLSQTHITDFPSGATFNVPPGAALLSFDYNYGTDKTTTKDDGGIFRFVENIPNYDLGGNGQSTVSVKNYVYPTELMYFGNSPLRISDKELASTAYPQSTASTDGGWMNDDSWTAANGWTTGQVSSSTRSVAMKYNINYGVALLETKVYIDNCGYLLDNTHAVSNDINGVLPGNDDPTKDPDKQIPVGNNLFALTGIIIGQQPYGVGWDYTPATMPSNTSADSYIDIAAYDSEKKMLTNWDRLVYDKVGGNEGVAIGTGVPSNPLSYTLLFDNYMNVDIQGKVQQAHTTSESTPAMQQQVVYVALEFKNLGDSFMGMHNMVRKGSKFYIIGALDPLNKNIMNGETPVTNRADGHPLPPYQINATSGDTENVWTPRVFMQDYVTRATFKIGQNSLKYAYLTIPNLKASQVSLGLSVDIEWETGLQFDNVILGGN